MIHKIKIKGSSWLIQFKRLLFLLFFIIIFLSAHSWGPGIYFWRGLSLLGSDIAMTPVTADMALMVDSQKTLYTREMFLELTFFNKSTRRLSLRDQDFYRIKLPLLLLMDLHRYGVSTELHQRALCWQLKKKFPETEFFSLKSNPLSNEDASLGLNRNFLCRL